MQTRECELIWNNLELKTIYGKKIISNSSGQIQPKTLTAILGPSGSGKSSLLDCLSGRISSKLQLRGEIKVNGNERDLKTWPKLVSYVGQQFHSYEWQTVYETFHFVASIKCEAFDQQEKDSKVKERIENLINLLGLDSSRDVFIGNLSGGERVRVSLGIELIVDPPVVLLDEPLSGLDSSNALSILLLLRKIADLGKTIMITIHQPSYNMLECFDKIILMSQGYCMFEGSIPDCVKFFNECGFEVPSNVTPTDFFLENLVVNTTDETTRMKSQKKIDVLRKEWMMISEQKTPTIFNKVSVSNSTETSVIFKTLFLRSIMNYTRNSKNIKSRIFQKAFILSLFCTTFYNTGVVGASIFTFRGILTFIFQNELFGVSSPIMNTFIEEKKAIKRERMSGFYSGFEAYFSKAFCEIVINLIFALPCNIIAYKLVGLQNDFKRMIDFITIIIFTVIYSVSWGLTISTVASTTQTAQIIGVTFNVSFMLYSGSFSDPSTLPPYLRWIVWISPMHYVFRALIHNQLSGIKKVDSVDTFKITGEDKIKVFGMDGFGVLPSLGVILLFSITLQLIGSFVLHYKTSNNLKLSKKNKEVV